jgi:hypothetical protein
MAATRWNRRGCDKGWRPAVSMRIVKEVCGNELFSSVDYVEPHFKGFDYYGAHPVGRRGHPVFCASFRPKPSPYEEVLRPNLHIFPIREEIFSASDWPDLRTPLREIILEWERYVGLPETVRLHRRVLLYTVDAGMIYRFVSK